MRTHLLFLLIFLSFASLSASAASLFDGGKGGTSPNPVISDKSKGNVETGTIIIYTEDDEAIPIVPHHLFEHISVDLVVDRFSRQMDIKYGYGLGYGEIEIRNTRTAESFRGIVTPDNDHFLINPTGFAGEWIIYINVQDEQGKRVIYFGGFEYRGRW